MDFDIKYGTIEGEQVAIIADKYVICKDGKLYNIAKNSRVQPRIVNNQLVVSLSINGKSTTVGIQKLVAEAFVNKPKSNEKLVVIHKDGNSFNNRYTNLMWASRQELSKKNYNTNKLQLRKKGKKIKLINRIECIEVEFNSITDATLYLMSFDRKLNFRTVKSFLSQALKKNYKVYGWDVMEIEESGN